MKQKKKKQVCVYVSMRHFSTIKRNCWKEAFKIIAEIKLLFDFSVYSFVMYVQVSL